MSRECSEAGVEQHFFLLFLTLTYAALANPEKEPRVKEKNKNPLPHYKGEAGSCFFQAF